MRAVILAGGKGRRLFPYTVVIPKPLVPMGDKSILEIVVRQLKRHQFRHLTMAVGYQAELIMALMGNGSKWGLQIDYSMESEPLGTIGPLREIESLHEPFLVMNGDLLCDIDYRQLMETHRSNGCIATVATCKQHVQLQLGVLRYDEQCRLTGFEEKPAFDYDVSMGIYVFDPRVCEYIPKQGPFGFDQLIHALLKAGEPVAVYPFDGHWLDIGTHEDLDNALREFEANRERYLPDD